MASKGYTAASIRACVRVCVSDRVINLRVSCFNGESFDYEHSHFARLSAAFH